MIKKLLNTKRKRRVFLTSIIGVAALCFAGLAIVGVSENVRMYKGRVNLMACWFILSQCVYDLNPTERIIDDNEEYNTGDKPLGSWRFGCLYASVRVGGQTVLSRPAYFINDRFNLTKNWNEEPNFSFHFKYFCWNNNRFSKRYNDTSVMAIVGRDTAMEAFQDHKFYDSNAWIEECSSTIFLVEAVDSGVHWGQPGDFNVETVTKERLFPGKTKGILVLFGDGSVWYIERTVPMETLKRFMTIESSKKHDRELELSRYGRAVFK